MINAHQPGSSTPGNLVFIGLSGSERAGQAIGQHPQVCIDVLFQKFGPVLQDITRVVNGDNALEELLFIIQLFQEVFIFATQTDGHPAVAAEGLLLADAVDHYRPQYLCGRFVIVKIIVFSVLHQGKRIERGKEEPAVKCVDTTKGFDDFVDKSAREFGGRRQVVWYAAIPGQILRRGEGEPRYARAEPTGIDAKNINPWPLVAIKLGVELRNQLLNNRGFVGIHRRNAGWQISWPLLIQVKSNSPFRKCHWIGPGKGSGCIVLVGWLLGYTY